MARGPGSGNGRGRGEEFDLARAVDDCTYCGNCISVCPAYTVTGHEQTTARGKLFLASRFLAGEEVEKSESDWAFHCTLCAACADVCQTEIPLFIYCYLPVLSGTVERRPSACEGLRLP